MGPPLNDNYDVQDGDYSGNNKKSYLDNVDLFALTLPLTFDGIEITPWAMLGVILGGCGVYQPLIDFAGAGATVPLTGFGSLLAKGVREAVREDGLLGALTGGLKAASGGIAAAVFFGFLAALIFKPKDKS